MGKLIFLLLIPFSAYSISIDNIFQDDTTFLERSIYRYNKSKIQFERIKIVDKFNEFSKDPEGKILDIFKVSDFFYDHVHFWFNVYTAYGTSQSVIHDKSNISIVYDVLDFSSLIDSKLSRHTRISIQNRLILEYTRKLKESFRNLSKDKNKNGTLEKRIVDALKAADVNIPRNKRKRKSFFTKLGQNIRAQTGQKDNIQSGLEQIQPYLSTLKYYFQLFELPQELLAIAFLESSFNVHAESKVGAVGVWQFMEHIGKHFLPMDKYRDGRDNPLMSTLGALHLLAQNKQILKSWDLAIPAYNSGTKHLIRARRKLSKKGFKPPINLETILKHYDHPHIGFASENFYTEFLALVYALNYSEHFFTHSLDDKMAKEEIKTYVSLCKLTPSWFFKEMKASSPDIKYLNSHISKTGIKHNFNRDLVLFSRIDLNPKKYFRITGSNLRRKFPRNFKHWAKNQSCSTK